MDTNEKLQMVLKELESLSEGTHFLNGLETSEEILTHLCINLAQICQVQQKQIEKLEGRSNLLIDKDPVVIKPWF